MLSNYDRTLKIVGLGLFPWPRLGPEKWFDDYRIYAAHNWDVEHAAGGLELISHPLIGRPIKNSNNILDTEVARELLTQGVLKDRYLLPYKPLVLPDWLPTERVLANDYELYRRLENKALFREEFGDIVPFPDYELCQKADLEQPDAYDRFSNLFGTFILQDDVLSGGQGTYKVSNSQLYAAAVEELKHTRGTRVVVSRFMANMTECSLQVVVTRYGVGVGPLQQQFVREPLLCWPNDQAGDKFCGAQIPAGQHHTATTAKLYKIATDIGERLQNIGYKGIFGIDLLIDTSKGQFFTLEVNARTTGTTPLHSMFDYHHAHTPFYPLHILELANAPYKLDADGLTKRGSFSTDASLLVLHVRDGKPHILAKAPRSGTYSWDGQSLTYAHPNVRFTAKDSKDSVVLQVHPSPQTHLAPGARLAFMFTRWLVQDNQGMFSPDAKRLIETVYDMFGLTNNVK